MAQRAHTLVVDESKGAAMKTNAAIWYAQDGFDPAAKGINGRRVAGESFLRGFLTHAEVEEFVFLTKTAEELVPVQALSARLRPQIPLRAVGMIRPPAITPLRTVFYPSPNYASETWRRAVYGSGAYALCGITHTISTAAVMQGWLDLRVSPVAEWDAVICTSKAVLSSVTLQMDLVDQHLRQHLRADPRPRPMLPVIPLGIHCDDFTPDAAAGQGLRERLGAGPQDVVFATIARLTPHEKFDPLPIYLAMQSAQAELGAAQKLHVVFCGVFRDDYSRKVFEAGAAALMPEVGFVILDGAKADERKAALSAADVFLFLIDNIQETFGLAPLEGMAAGLPLLVSDWDGMKDTVSPDVGFRVTSRSLPASHLANEALRYHGGIDSYVQYCAAASAMTEIDMGELRARILDLAQNPALRKRMGAAGQARARALYDWSKVVPQMQDLWAEQEARRAVGQSQRYAADLVPVAPSPTALFGNYPTEQVNFAGQRFVARDLAGRPGLTDTLALRDYLGTRRIFAAPEQIAAVLAAITATSPTATSLIGAEAATLATACGLSPLATDRVLIWLLKYDFIRRI